MSRKSQRAILLLSAVFLLTLFPHTQARADTYEIFQFTDYSGAGPILYIDDHGRVVFHAFCNDGGLSCFSVFQPFGPIFTSSQLPPFNYTGAAVFDPGGLTSMTLFNDGYEADFDGTTRTIFGGPEGDLQPLREGVVADFIAINNYGDIAWTNGEIELNFLAYDVTAHITPEPATIALLLTGLIPITIIARRKLIRATGRQPKIHLPQLT
jgi:hypothetical protein